LVRPLTVQLVVDVVQVKPPGEEVTVYREIAVPPVVEGAVQETWELRLPTRATDALGAPGTVAGVAGAEGAEAGPVPAGLLATTSNS
jgi:hypothetical protein